MSWWWKWPLFPDYLRICYVPADKESHACTYYRCSLPAAHLTATGETQTILLKDGWPAEKIQQIYSSSDVVIFQRPFSEYLFQIIRRFRMDRHAPLAVVENDDNTFDVSPYNPAYWFHGLRDVMLPDHTGKKRFLWRTGVTPNDNGSYFQPSNNAFHRDIMRACLREAECLLTAGEGLSRFYRVWNRNVILLKNGIDLSIWKKLPRTHLETEIRLGWQGGASHYDDWNVIRNVMTEVGKRHPQVKFVLYGQHFEGFFKRIDPRRVEKVGWVHVEAHPIRSATLDLDLAVIPLRDDAFSRGKSIIKWIEFSALGIPTVVSRAGCYAELRDGIDCLKAGTEEEWTDQIGRLVSDAALRRSLGERAREKVLRDFDVRNLIPPFLDRLRTEILRKRRGEFLDGREASIGYPEQYHSEPDSEALPFDDGFRPIQDLLHDRAGVSPLPAPVLLRP